MKKICLVSNLHLCANPRLWKEANSLADAGYEVVILTIWTSAEKREQDKLFIRHQNIRYKAAINLIREEVSSVRRFYMRARRRLSIELKKRLGIDTSWILDFAPATMLQAALRENADLYICHTEYGMQVGRELILRKQPVAFDIEDWYSKDYLGPSRPVQLLEQLEKFALDKGLYCTCPSLSMVDGLQISYIPKKRAHVIYNGFSMSETPDYPQARRNGRLPSLVWFSQVVGPGRGLETLMEALQYVNVAIELHLLGKCDDAYAENLRSLFPAGKGHQLFFHAPIPHAALLHELQQHDIGLALENNTPANKLTTVSNKVLQYLQAGLKMLVTFTEGQVEIAQEFRKTVIAVTVNEPAEWAEAVEELIAAESVNREVQLEKFNRLYSWEAQEKKLLQLVDSAVNKVPEPENFYAN